MNGHILAFSSSFFHYCLFSCAFKSLEAPTLVAVSPQRISLCPLCDLVHGGAHTAAVALGVSASHGDPQGVNTPSPAVLSSREVERTDCALIPLPNPQITAVSKRESTVYCGLRL